MRQAQILAYGLDGPLAARLAERAQSRGVSIRQVQHVDACRGLLRSGGPAVLVLMLHGELIEELGLLEEVTRVSPDTAVVVVGDADNPGLAALAWDLGARCVLQPPQPIEHLPDIALRLLPAETR